jgi:hypothetical protein
MALLWGTYLTVFLAGMLIGYGVRAVISSRRRAEAQRRYDATGSYRRLAMVDRETQDQTPVAVQNDPEFSLRSYPYQVTIEPSPALDQERA